MSRLWSTRVIWSLALTSAAIVGCSSHTAPQPDANLILGNGTYAVGTGIELG